MPPKQKAPQAADRKDETSFAMEAYALLKDGFAAKKIDIAPFCSQKDGFVKSIISVKEGGALAGSTGIKFADGILYVGRQVFERYASDPAGFARAAINSVKDGLDERSHWDKRYRTREQDFGSLDAMLERMKGTALDRRTVPTRSLLDGHMSGMPDYEELLGKKEEGMIELEGKVFVPKSVDRLYKSIEYEKSARAAGVVLLEQAFANAYLNYQRAVSAGEIKPGLFVVADFNFNSAQRRFYLLDFAKPDRPVVKDAITMAHGIMSDPERDGYVKSLSNTENSHQSSMGLYRIVSSENRAEYKGYVWRLEGRASSSFRAQQRGILIHYKRSNYTFGCFGLDPGEADRIGLPLDGNSASRSEETRKAWVGVGVYVYFDPNVQRDVCKKHWPVKKTG